MKQKIDRRHVFYGAPNRVRTFLQKVYRRIHHYLAEDQTILLQNNPRYQQWDIGDYTYGRPKVVYFGGDANLKIGKFCSIAEDVVIIANSSNRISLVTTYPFNAFFDKAATIEASFPKNSITIGHDVWIGVGATILPGVSVGNGAIIGANSIITKDVPAYAIVAGNPAKVLRKRFSEQIIDQLEEIKWWDWPIEKIEQEFGDLLSPNGEYFVQKHTRLLAPSQVRGKR